MSLAASDPEMDPLTRSLVATLKACWGYSSFRPLQLEVSVLVFGHLPQNKRVSANGNTRKVISEVVASRDVLLLMATGSGE
jgi:superfamily II DNA helicase RecQ